MNKLHCSDTELLGVPQMCYVILSLWVFARAIPCDNSLVDTNSGFNIELLDNVRTPAAELLYTYIYSLTHHTVF